MTKDVLEGLNEQQRQVVMTVQGPVLVLAGAGSGKTRALTHRIAYLVQQGHAQPDQILAVTFTNKAAKEMRERVARLVGGRQAAAITLSTFHSLGVRILREQHRSTQRSANFSILDTSDSERLIKEALAAHNLSPKQWSPRTIRHSISRAKNELLTPAAWLARATTPMDEVAARTYETYEALLARYDSYDFDDLIVETLRLLTEQPSVRAHYQQRWLYVSIDEYQDTNPPQDALIRQLLNPARNLCVVGDDYQAIYSWRGAQVDHILRFETHFPTCTTIYLTQNYRSTAPILTAANCVIAENKEQKHKELWTQRATGTPVQLICAQSDRAEAAIVRTALQQHLANGGRARDCAILYRTNAQSRLLEEEFMVHQIPYVIIGGLKFYQRAEVKDAMALAQLLVNPKSVISLQRIVRAAVRGVGLKTIARLAGASGTLVDHLTNADLLSARQLAALRPVAEALRQAGDHEGQGPAVQLKTLLTTSGYFRQLQELPDGEERRENLNELLTVAAQYASLRDFIEAVALLSDLDEPVGTDGQSHDRVYCMTLHAAKGLEFERVFLVGCEEGLLPHRNSTQSPAELEEERRLLYVGMTRAKEHLTLLYAIHRTQHGETLPGMPSRFLEALPAEVEHIEPEVTLPRTSFSEGLAHFISDNPSDEPVYETYAVGDMIAHPHFGSGIVIQAHGSTVTCVFEGHGVKTVDASTSIA